MERCSEVRSARRGRPAGCWCLAGGRHARQAQALDRGRQAGRGVASSCRAGAASCVAGMATATGRAGGSRHGSVLACLSTRHHRHYARRPPGLHAVRGAGDAFFLEERLACRHDHGRSISLTGTGTGAQRWRAGGPCVHCIGWPGWLVCYSWACLPHDSMSE
jgi:hypothetical protein